MWEVDNQLKNSFEASQQASYKIGMYAIGMGVCFKLHTLTALISYGICLLGDSIHCRMISTDEILGASCGFSWDFWDSKMSVKLDSSYPTASQGWGIANHS